MKPQERNRLILQFIYTSAMRDATLQRAFPYKKRNLEKLDDFLEIKKELEKFIGFVLGRKIQSQKEYDEAFNKLAKKICNEINNNFNQKDLFKFGNAQKLINMVMKQLYISCYNDPQKRKCFEFCHCPMDTQLMEVVWKKRDEENLESIKIKKRDEFFKAWSKIENTNTNQLPEDYDAFQQAIRKICKKMDIYPLEYDYINWNN